MSRYALHAWTLAALALAVPGFAQEKPKPPANQDKKDAKVADGLSSTIPYDQPFASVENPPVYVYVADDNSIHRTRSTRVVRRKLADGILTLDFDHSFPPSSAIQLIKQIQSRPGFTPPDNLSTDSFIPMKLMAWEVKIVKSLGRDRSPALGELQVGTRFAAPTGVTNGPPGGQHGVSPLHVRPAKRPDP